MVHVSRTINRRQFVQLIGTVALNDRSPIPSDNPIVALSDLDWELVLSFVRTQLQEIAEFDDESDEYLALTGVIVRIEQQRAKMLANSFLANCLRG